MPRSVLWGLAALTAAIAVALVAVLVRRRRADPGSWTTGDYLVALGIALAFLGTLLSLLAVANSDGESQEVREFRSDVQAACRSLLANAQSSPIPPLIDDNGNVARQPLIDGLNGQLDAGAAILATIWNTPDIPDELTADVQEAHEAADVVLFVQRADIDALAAELPDPVGAFEALGAIAAKTVDDAGRFTTFEAAMSKLAGEPCRDITALEQPT